MDILFFWMNLFSIELFNAWAFLSYVHHYDPPHYLRDEGIHCEVWKRKDHVMDRNIYTQQPHTRAMLGYQKNKIRKRVL